MKKCERCGKKFPAMSKHQKFCDDCHKNHDLKGGQEKMVTAEQKRYNEKIEKMAKKEKTEKQVSEPKVNVSEKRESDAKKLIEFMKKDLSLKDEDLTKVISRAYRIIKEK